MAIETEAAPTCGGPAWPWFPLYMGLCLATSILTTSVALAAESVQVVSSADSRVEIFVKGSGSRIYHAWQTRAGSGSAATTWTWETSDVAMSGDDFIAGRDSQGRVFVAAI